MTTFIFISILIFWAILIGVLGLIIAIIAFNSGAGR
jgi:hypothetical protein